MTRRKKGAGFILSPYFTIFILTNPKKVYMLILMKRFLAPLIAFLSYLILAPSAFAAIIDCNKMDEPFKTLCKVTTDPTTAVPNIIAKAISFIFVIAVVVAIFFLLWGALKWIYSGGDKAAIESARGTITAAVIGLVILFLTFLIFTVVLNFFNINILNVNFPSINAI